MTRSQQRLCLLACLGAGAGSMGVSTAHADVRFNGFGQIVVGSTLDNSRPMPLQVLQNDYSADPDFLSESLFGLQAQAALSNSLTATAQIVADGAPNNYSAADATHVCAYPDPECNFGHDDFKPRFTWAYATWTINDNWSIKGGRQRIPFYKYSDYLQVGEAYPWVRPPMSVYNIPVQNFDGLSLNGAFSVGDWFIQPQIIYGELQGQVFDYTVVSDLKATNLVAADLDVSYNDWLTLRVAYSEDNITDANHNVPALQSSLSQISFGESELSLLTGAAAQTAAGLGDQADAAALGTAAQEYAVAAADHATVIPAFNVQSETYQYSSIGLEVDKYNFIFDGEYVYSKAPKIIPTEQSYYASFGYHFGHLTPLLTYGHTRLRAGDGNLARTITGDGTGGAGNAAGAENKLFGGNYNTYAGDYNANSATGCTANPALCLPLFDPGDFNPADTQALPNLMTYGSAQLATGLNGFAAQASAVQDFYEAGMRYDLSRNTALKLDYTYYASPQQPPPGTPQQGFQHAQLLSAAFVFTF